MGVSDIGCGWGVQNEWRARFAQTSTCDCGNSPDAAAILRFVLGGSHWCPRTYRLGPAPNRPRVNAVFSDAHDCPLSPQTTAVREVHRSWCARAGGQSGRRSSIVMTTGELPPPGWLGSAKKPGTAPVHRVKPNHPTSKMLKSSAHLVQGAPLRLGSLSRILDMDASGGDFGESGVAGPTSCPSS